MSNPTSTLYDKLKCSPINHSLWDLALSHPSVNLLEKDAAKRREYQRLEFLGDAVVALVISDELYKKHPDLNEGELAIMRANLVNVDAMRKVAADISLEDNMKLQKAKNENLNHNHNKKQESSKNKILANTLEALIGAIYIDHGFTAASEVILRIWMPYICVSAHTLLKQDGKSELQTYSLRNFRSLPRYKTDLVIDSEEEMFRSYVTIDQCSTFGEGTGKNKKISQINAALDFIKKVKA